jgi:hypothetical protein
MGLRMITGEHGAILYGRRFIYCQSDFAQVPAVECVSL